MKRIQSRRNNEEEGLRTIKKGSSITKEKERIRTNGYYPAKKDEKM
jgi:hypothetical protein